VVLEVGAARAHDVPEEVYFPSRDGKTQLVGFLFKSDKQGPFPAVVMMHGRSGAYSSLYHGTYTAQTLNQRHKMWGEFWAARGYLALHVDSFGPRGYPQGFPRHSYSARPPEVSEQWVRPLDAYGALDYLRSRGDVVADRIVLQGWSNGGMALLSAMGQTPPGLQHPTPGSGFRAALALYPGCRTQFNQDNYTPYAPLLLMVAADDDEVSPQVCVQFAQAVQAREGRIAIVSYEGAHHAYDDPGRRKQSHAPNRAALEDSKRRAEHFFSEQLQR
jgi:carboxymethylenebutenolidase